MLDFHIYLQLKKKQSNCLTIIYNNIDKTQERPIAIHHVYKHAKTQILPIAPPPSTRLSRHSIHNITGMEGKLRLLRCAREGVFGCVCQSLLLLLLLLAAHDFILL
jgi:hypothetical protein